jgi:hypothetical protein
MQSAEMPFVLHGYWRPDWQPVIRSHYIPWYKQLSACRHSHMLTDRLVLDPVWCPDSRATQFIICPILQEWLMGLWSPTACHICIRRKQRQYATVPAIATTAESPLSRIYASGSRKLLGSHKHLSLCKMTYSVSLTDVQNLLFVSRGPGTANPRGEAGGKIKCRFPNGFSLKLI